MPTITTITKDDQEYWVKPANTQARCVTHQNAVHNTLAISRSQEAAMRAAGVWPRCSGGCYTDVKHGESWGSPTLSSAQVERLIAGETIGEIVAR